MRIRTLTAAAIICCSFGVAYAEEKPTDSEAEAVDRANEAFYAALNAMFAGDLQSPERETCGTTDSGT